MGIVTETTAGRAPFQVLVLVYRISSKGPRYALLRREDTGYWQGIAGGGDAGESPVKAARREAAEEAGLTGTGQFVALDSRAMIPVVYVTGQFTWGEDVLVIPEYAFGAAVGDRELTLSHEHTEYRWATLDEALEIVRWDSNRTALWELDHRVRHGMLTGSPGRQAPQAHV